MSSENLFKVELIEKKNDNGQMEVNGMNRNNILNGLSIGLSCYETLCKPREITNIDGISISPSQIERITKEILTCSICFGIYQDPVNIKSCLHKFCKKCIEDFNRKVKKECVICRHPIETRRLMKEDKKINEIIRCIIPDMQKYQEEEEKALEGKFVFKDEERMKHQMEQANKIEEIESKEYRNNISSTHNNHHHKDKSSGSSSQHHQENNSNRNNASNISEETNVLIGRKTQRDLSNGALEAFNKGNNIIVKLNCDDNEESLKNYFQKTKIFLQDSFTLEFISRFICYKQNFKCEQIKKIDFYTINNDKSKKFWDQSKSLKELMNYQNEQNAQVNTENANNNIQPQEGGNSQNVINLYFLRSQ